MGRIDEALKRAGENAPVTPHAAVAPTPFVSPWSVAGAPDSAPVQEHRTSTLLQTSGPHQFLAYAPDWTERLVTHEKADPALVEQFRRLAGVLHQAQTTENVKVLMVTSALTADGKTFTALNLALTLSGSYCRRVLLVDMDLRRPSISRICGIGNTSGLSDGLRSTTEQKLSVIQLGENLTLLPAGRPDPDPMSSLTSPRMQSILREAAEGFDWVILDAPPVGPLADAGMLAAMVDKVLLVVRAAQTPYPVVAKAIESVGRDRIFGVVLNSVDESDSYGYANHGKYVASRQDGVGEAEAL